MAGKEKFDWRLWVASSAALAIVLILLTAGGMPFMYLLVMVVYCALVVFLLMILWRAMRAHERLADALEKLAQHNDNKMG